MSKDREIRIISSIWDEYLKKEYEKAEKEDNIELRDQILSKSVEIRMDGFSLTKEII